eukprot:6214332-Pleurochrysis_carterae.AAC.1
MVEVHQLAAVSIAAKCVVDEGGQLRSCGHGVVGVDAARRDLVDQLGDADRDKFLKIGAEVGPAEVGREYLGPFVAQGRAARVCGDDVVDVEQHNHHLVAPDQVREARFVLELGEAKRDEGPTGEVAEHVANLCNHLAAVLVPPLVALWDVGVALLVGWPVSFNIALGNITALHVKVMLSSDDKDRAQRLDGG